MQVRGPRVGVIVVGIEGEVNLGFIARLVKNFAADELVLVTPQASPGSEIARRYAAKAVDVLERVRIVGSLSEALQGYGLSACTSARVGYKTDVLRHPITPRELAELSLKYDSVAVVFGRESVGLTRDEIAQCDVMVTIPANPEYPVLNLSHAVAVILYELWLARLGGRVEFHEKADEESIKRIERLGEEVARLTVDEQRVPHVVAALKHCVARAALTRGEASALYYLFKRLYHALLGGQRGDTGDH